VTPKIKLHRAIEGDIQRLNIRRMPTGKWFASFFVEVEPDEPLPKTGLSIGFDVGLKSFITLSNGEHVDEGCSSRSRKNYQQKG
jgi:putative transposase